MSKKDYVAYAVFTMLATGSFFVLLAAFGFIGSFVGLFLGTLAGLVAMRLVTRHSLRFGVYVLGISTALWLSMLYGVVRLKARSVTMAHLRGRWHADLQRRWSWQAQDPGVSLEIGDSTAVLDMPRFSEPIRFHAVLQDDSLVMTSAKTNRFAWRIHSLTETRMNIGAKEGVLDFEREE